MRYVNGRYEETIELCRHTIDMEADFAAPHRLLAAATLQLGDAEGSVRYLDSNRSIHQDPTTRAWLAHAAAVQGDRARAMQILGELDAMSHARYISAYHRALGWTGLGDFDAAFALLCQACEERDPSLMHLASEPRFAVLRSDTRYATLAARIGLPGAPALNGARSQHV